MRAFAPAHYTQLDTRGAAVFTAATLRKLWSHARDTKVPNKIYTTFYGTGIPRAATMRTGVRRNRTRHLVAPERSAGAWTSCGQRPGRARVVKVILHARARDR